MADSVVHTPQEPKYKAIPYSSDENVRKKFFDKISCYLFLRIVSKNK
jgi:hypothetical protein